MKRTFLSLGLLFLSISMLIAGPISRTQAKQAAQDFFAQRESGAVTDCRLDFVYQSRDTQENLFYIFNRGDNDGFVLISADDIFPEIIGYSFKGHFDLEKMPDNLRSWLHGYEKEMLAVLSGKGEAINVTEEATPSRDLPSAIAPILETGIHIDDPIKWDQTYPFNALEPMLPSGKQAYTGCVATALAQIMRHYKWPDAAVGGYDYYDTMEGYNTHYSGSFGEKYDWENMPGTVGGLNVNSAQEKALATLMRDVSFSVDMQFTEYGSGTYSIFVERALRQTFKYKHTAQYLHRYLMTTNEWKTILRQELTAGRPIYYSGSDSEAGHAFVCDGYEADGTFHFNWGWSGISDGYFYLNLLNPSSLGTGAGNGGYSTEQEIVVGIEPLKPGDENPTLDPAIALAELNHEMTEEALNIDVKIKNFSTYVGDVQIAYHLTLADGNESTTEATSVPIVYADLIGESTAAISIPREKFSDGKNIITILYKTEGMPNWKKLKHYTMGLINKIEVTMPEGEVSYFHTDAQIAMKAGSLSYSLKAFSNGRLNASFYNPGTEEFRSRVTFALRNEEGRLYFLGKRLLELAPGDEEGENISLDVTSLKARAGEYKFVCTSDMGYMPEEAEWIEMGTIQVAPCSNTFLPLLVASNPQVDLLTIHRKNPEQLPVFDIINEGADFNGKLYITIKNRFGGNGFLANEKITKISNGEKGQLGPNLSSSSAFYTDTETYPDDIYYVRISKETFWEASELLGDNYYRIQIVTDQSTPDIENHTTPSMKVYPNPTSKYVNISLPIEYIGSMLRIFDIQGKIQLSTEVNSTTMRLEIGQLKEGSYIISVGNLVEKLQIH